MLSFSLAKKTFDEIKIRSARVQLSISPSRLTKEKQREEGSLPGEIEDVDTLLRQNFRKIAIFQPSSRLLTAKDPTYDKVALLGSKSMPVQLRINRSANVLAFILSLRTCMTSRTLERGEISF